MGKADGSDKIKGILIRKVKKRFKKIRLGNLEL